VPSIRQRGSFKEGGGKLIGDEKLKAEGMADKAKGSAKSAVDGAANKL